VVPLSDKLGLYIHIPFCRSKCDYCDFYSLAGRENRMDDYQKALLAHMKETGPLTRGYQVDTVYFGGGTPSFYGEKRLRALLSAVGKHFDLSKDAEITVECNPDSVDKKMLAALHRAGVNRLSLGVQSARDCELQRLHRPHDFRQAWAAVEAARAAKFKNLSLDVIYGLPGQDMAAWQDTVEQVLALEPEHLSCYGLKVEPGTPLDDRVVRGEVLPDDDMQADMYLWMVDRLAAAGYRQYEISNFARSGFQSRHNLKYWMGRPYIGFGPGAHSDFGGRRYSFVRDLDAYITGVLGGGAVIDESELIPQRERGGEYLMLRLRTTRGIEEWEYRREFFMNFDPLEQKLEEYERQGWAERHDRRWNLTARGFLVSNQLIGDLLSLQEESTLEQTLPKLRQMERGGEVHVLEEGESPAPDSNKR
jgi:putative oxygen-independent coproporphyrinogen III oxidase